MRYRPLLFSCCFMLGLLMNLAGQAEEPKPYAPQTGKHSLEFKGKGQVIIPKLRYDGSHPITLEAWAMPYLRDKEVVRSSVVANLQLAGVGLHHSNGHWMAHFNEGRDSNAGYASSVSDSVAINNQPVHLAAVYDGNNFILYVDGKPQKYISQVTLKHVPSPFDFMVGADPNGKGQPHQFFEGAIDEVRISKVARYTDDFEPARRFQPDKETLVLYHFDEGEGDVAHDASENHYDGKIKGAKWIKQIEKEEKQAE